MPQGWAHCQAVCATLIRQGVALLFPPVCMGCHARLPAAEPSGFCATCYAGLPWWNPSHVLPPTLSPKIDSFAAPFLYEGPLRHAILQFKFQDVPALATPLARLMRFSLPPTLTAPLLVPVPCHSSRLRKRLYNQSALLAQILAKETGFPCAVSALKRIRSATPQNQKTKAQRQALSSTEFEALPIVNNKDIILIDDILTTGSTARACAISLKRAGARTVHIRTIAYTKP